MHLMAGSVVGRHGRIKKELNSMSLFQRTITASDFRSMDFMLRNIKGHPNQNFC